MNNRKIGMAINYDYPDYGGMLQAYASYQIVKSLGYEPEAINIDSLVSDIKRRKLKYFIENIFDLSIVREKSKILIKKVLISSNKDLRFRFKQRYDAFEKFYKEHFKVSREYKNWNDLRLSCKDYSSVVVGSDQLWLPSNIAGDYYTLSFVPDDVNKIAYATSFGVSKIDKRQELKVREYLSRINYLSAREESGQRIIKKYTNRDVQLVCDPALLLTAREWDEYVKPERIIESKYIFCYFMGDNPWQRDFVKKLKERTGYRIVALLHLDQYIKSDEIYIDEAPYSISPTDFINLVKNSEMVCTDSFHGTVFSLIYEKKFYTFMRFSGTETLSTNSRIKTLLKKLGAEDRLITKDFDLDTLFKQNIDFNRIQTRLESFRNESLEYLTKALEKSKNDRNKK